MTTIEQELINQHKQKVGEINELMYQLETRVKNAKSNHQKSIIITFNEVDKITSWIQELF